MNFITDLDVKGKLVFLRVDFNVPLDENGAIRDDTRIKASLPTIQWLLDHGARLVIASHLGRPKGKVDPKMSLKPAAERLAELIPNKVVMAPDVVGDEVARLKRDLGEGEALLLENVRFYKEEEKNDPEFAQKLAEDIDIFVNDAFGSSHRAHASVVGIADYVPVKAAGYLMKKEVDYLKKAVHTPGEALRRHPRRGQGLGWCVDLDLEKFFDRVNHDRLMSRIAKRIADKRLLKVIRAFLNAGVMENGLVGALVWKGAPQGWTLSPLLCNLVLDELDEELEAGAIALLGMRTTVISTFVASGRVNG